ncbi:hypothetical protein FPF71_17750 [Algibacter amylolyticus]|uniref:Uncharacterized protein n=1 Tax=Algibacter amylolyticus TaxID=1608400 RepID=A0A5M7AWS1_9FLAO|nr:hypothetical protein F2B50_17750 [Algibacter amylolyticus]TSJ71066.1 hypothetical protein FPF71_17750 [Algibacter amylolyticus]
MFYNVYVYEMLRVCVRGFSEGKSEANKRATNFGLGKTSNFLYTLLWLVIFVRHINFFLKIFFVIAYSSDCRIVSNIFNFV